MQNKYIIPISANSNDELNHILKDFINRLELYKNEKEYNIENIQQNFVCKNKQQEDEKNIRIAFLATDKDNLLSELTEFFFDQNTEKSNVFVGNPKKQNISVQSNDTNETAQYTLNEIAQLWCWGRCPIEQCLNEDQNKANYVRLDLYSNYYEKNEIPLIKRNNYEENKVLPKNTVSNSISTSSTTILQESFTLNGDEAFIVDHDILGEKLAPAAMYIEFIYELLKTKMPFAIHNIAWIKTLDQFPATIIVKLVQERNDIYTVTFCSEQNELYCTANISWNNYKTSLSQEINPGITTENISSSESLNFNEIYSLITDLGIHYGNTFQMLNTFQSNAEFAFSSLSKVPHVSYRQFDLSIIDASFQAALLFNKKNTDSLSIPYAADQIISFDSLEKASFVTISKRAKKLDLTILDENQHIIFQILGFLGVKFNSKKKIINYIPKISHLSLEAEKNKLFFQINDSNTKYFSNDTSISLDDFTKKITEHVKIYVLVTSTNYMYVYEQILFFFKAYLTIHQNAKFIVIANLNNSKAIPIFFATYSFIKTAMVENGGGSVDIKDVNNTPITQIDKQLPSNLYNTSIQKNKMYIVTGGNGGIGKQVVNEISKKGGIPVILSRNVKKCISANYLAIPVDITNKIELQQVFNKYGLAKSRGIFHFAGSLNDEQIFTKTIESSVNVIKSKITGILNLNELQPNFDFEILSSSLVSISGNIGQCDYTFANGFLNGYALSKTKNKNITSILWPLWKNGGMEIPTNLINIFTEKTGQSPLTNQEGLKILFNSKLPRGCNIIIKGQQDKAKQWINDKGEVILYEL